MVLSLSWTASEILKATNGRAFNGVSWMATGFSMDSRIVEKGDVFIALKGEAGTDKYRTSGQDGHAYVASAYEKGAVAAIVDHEIDCDIPQIIVPDTFRAFYEIASFSRHRASLLQAVAVTGSVGKTGTRDLIKAAFIGAGMRTHASIKSYNNMFGVPYTLATMPQDTQAGVFEIGMNFADEITPLSKLVEPTMAVMTSIADVHIENFSDGINGVVKAKSEIFYGMESDGIAILPFDNAYYSDLVANAKQAGLSRIYSFGEKEGADARLIGCELTADGTEIVAEVLGERVGYKLQIAGKHIAINSLSALLVVKLSGLGLQNAVAEMTKIQPLQGRGTRKKIVLGDIENPLTLIDETYNASPVAMAASFQVLSMIEPGQGGRRVAVLGDMLELGDGARGLHTGLLDPLVQSGVDVVYCCGQNMKALYDMLPDAMKGAHADTSADLAPIVVKAVHDGDIVMVKGSLGSKMGVIIDALHVINA